MHDSSSKLGFMERVPAELALLALRQSGHKISPSTLRMWVHRGHITRGPGGYDLAEILNYLDRRGTPPHATSDLTQTLHHGPVTSR